MVNQTISQRFREDHRLMDDLLKRYREYKILDPQRAREYFQQWASVIKKHFFVEEEIVFLAFDKKCGDKHAGLTDRLRIEHGKIRQLLGLVSDQLAAGKRDPDRDELLLMSALTAHENQEDATIYPWLEEKLSVVESRLILMAVENIAA